MPRRGDIENAELESETRDGAPSKDSARDASETAGEGRAPSMPCRGEKLVDVRVSGLFDAGLGKESAWSRSSRWLR